MIHHHLNPEGSSLVLIDGRFGSGKSTVGEDIARHYEDQGVSSITLSIDLDCRSREERARIDHNAAEWHQYRLMKAVIAIWKRSIGPGTISDDFYNEQTGVRDLRATITVPDPRESILILEGTSILYGSLDVISSVRHWMHRTSLIFVDTDEQECERRTFERDLCRKGASLTAEQIRDRITHNRIPLRDYRNEVCERDRFLLRQRKSLGAPLLNKVSG